MLSPLEKSLLTSIRLSRVLCAFVFLSCLSLADFSHAEREGTWFAFAPSWFTPEIAGDLTLGGIGNTPLDAEDILDLEGDDSLAGDLELHTGRHHFRLRALPFEFDGQEVLPVPVTVLGIPFSAGNLADSKLEVNTYRLAYRFDAISTRYFQLSPVVELGYVDADLRISNLSVPGAIVKDDLRSPLPLVGLHAQVMPHQRVRLFVEAAGFRANSWDELNNARILDAEAGVSLGLLENAWLTAAYRDTDFRFESGITEFDMGLEGLSLRFEMRD